MDGHCRVSDFASAMDNIRSIILGSIYKRTRKRPIPEGAEVVTLRDKAMVQWGGKTGKKFRSPLTDDGQHMLVTSQMYYMKYTDENGLSQIDNTNTTDRLTAQQILSAREKRVAEIKANLVDPMQEHFAKETARPIQEHLDDFEQYLKDKGNTKNHVHQTIMHIEGAIEWIEAKRFGDLTRDQVTRFLGHLRTEQRAKTRHGKKTRNARTINSYQISIKSFTRWMYESRRCKLDPLVGLKKFSEGNDRRHERRALTSEEFNHLIEAADNAKGLHQGIDGPTRAALYTTAAMTGLRRKELASLTRSDFRLDAVTPTVRIQGAYSKNKKTDEIPLHPDVVDRLRRYFKRTKPADGQPVFPLRAPGGGLRATSRMMKVDLDAARAAWINNAKDDPAEMKEREQSDFLKYATSDGVADFHANRVLFITSLCRSNVGLVMAQKLARHSDPKLTANIYSKVSTDERAAAIGGAIRL